MFIVKYYHRDRFLGEENFTNLEKAEDSLYESAYSIQGDYYEIIDTSTDEIIQEFVIPNYDYIETGNAEDHSFNAYENQDWIDLTRNDF